MLNKGAAYYIFALLTVGQLGAQLPNSNIYMFNFKKIGQEYNISQAQLLTGFNTNGYNNQPSFNGDDIIYLTTNYYDSLQTEIASLRLYDNTLERISYTPQSEYSPMKVPYTSKISCVRVESPDSTQHLVLYPLGDNDSGVEKPMETIDNLGYYNWLDRSTLAMFLVNPPHHVLAFADLEMERKRTIIDKVGRTLKTDRDGLLYFVHKMDKGNWYIKSYDPQSNNIKLIQPTVEDREDFELLNNGSILMGKGSELFINEPNKGSADNIWRKIADFSHIGIENITRIVVRKNKLLIVNVIN